MASTVCSRESYICDLDLVGSLRNWPPTLPALCSSSDELRVAVGLDEVIQNCRAKRMVAGREGAGINVTSREARGVVRHDPICRVRPPRRIPTASNPGWIKKPNYTIIDLFNRFCRWFGIAQAPLELCCAVTRCCSKQRTGLPDRTSLTPTRLASQYFLG